MNKQHKIFSVSRLCLFLAILSMVSAKCTKPENYNPAPENPELIRRDSITTLLLSELSSDSLKSYVQWLESMRTRFALSDNRRKIANAVAKRFISYGITDINLDSFRVTLDWQGKAYNLWQYNVIAHLHGTEFPDSLCVIGAHYDNILTDSDPLDFTPGANDNASGVAVVLETARVMMKMNFKPRGSINFVAFGAEEFGLAGSKDYASKLSVRGEKIVMMINYDMVAYEPHLTANSWYLNIIHYSNALPLSETSSRLCSKYSNLTPANDNTNFRRSDSFSFFNNGFKAVYFTSHDNFTDYHTTKDLVSSCNFVYCREVSKVGCSLLVDRN